ncbi:MAG: 50S ribosomal protein L10 [Thermosphaera sp.]
MSAITRVYPKWKTEQVEELVELLRNHKAFLVGDLTGVPASHIQRLRKKLAKTTVVRVVKPKLFAIALERAGINPEIFRDVLTGQNIVFFTNENPFDLAMKIHNTVTMDYYKPGEKTDKEIVIPEGNTGIPPGPMLSVFGKLKIQTKVQANVIHVAKDTVVAKPGDVVSPELSSLLQKLGLALKEIRLKLKIAYDGVLIPGENLVLNINEYVEMIKLAGLDALKIAVELALPEPEVLPLALSRAVRQATAIAVEAGYVTPETVELVLKTAESRAQALAYHVSKLAPELGIEVKVAVAQAPESKPKKEEKPAEAEEKKEEGVSEETLAEGLSALFG